MTLKARRFARSSLTCLEERGPLIKLASVRTWVSRLVRSFTARVLEADPSALPASAFAGSRLLDEAERAELDALLKAGAGGSSDNDNEEEAGQ